MAMDWNDADRLAALHGEAFYRFLPERFRGNYLRMHRAFSSIYPSFRIAYSYKTNYCPTVCRMVDDLGGTAEVVSEMEFELASRLGINGDRIIYNGPCKSLDSIRACLWGGGIVNLDSRRDLDLVLGLEPAPDGRIGRIGIRCNFPLGEGFPSRFGIDIDSPLFAHVVAKLRSAPGLRLSGLHCHFPDRDLETYAGRCEGILAAMRSIPGFVPDFLNIGGGYYSTIPPSLRARIKGEPPTYEDYARIIASRFAQEFPDGTYRPELIIEPGTALVADTFEFVTRVIDVKAVRGRTVATTAGSIFNISPTARITELPLTVLRRAGSTPAAANAQFDIAGFTCIEGDCMSRGVAGAVAPGDFLLYGNVGSYSLVMKPPFIQPNFAVLEEGAGGGHRVIKRREDFSSVFNGFVDLTCA